MSRKRAATGDLLTGGSKDVNPQYINTQAVMTAANTYFEQVVNMPIQRLPNASGKALVVELLRAYFDMPEIDNTNAADTFYKSTVTVATKSFAAQQTLNNGAILCMAQRIVHKAFTAAGSYEGISTDPLTWDFTDGAGHGVLVGTDSLIVGIVTAGYANPTTVTLKLLYRMKEVTLAEYIGIVQSQQ